MADEDIFTFLLLSKSVETKTHCDSVLYKCWTWSVTLQE